MRRPPTGDDIADYNGDVDWMIRMRVIDDPKKKVSKTGTASRTRLASSLESGAESAINVHVNMDTTCGEFCDTKLMMKYANNQCPTRLRGTRFEELLPELQKFPNQKLWIRLLEIGVETDSDPVNQDWYREVWKWLGVVADNKLVVNAKDMETREELHPVIVDGHDTVGELMNQTGFKGAADTGGIRSDHWASDVLLSADEREDLDTFMAGESSDMGDLPEMLDYENGFRAFRRSPRVAINEKTEVADIRAAILAGPTANEMQLQETPLAELERVLLHLPYHSDLPSVARQMGKDVEDVIALVNSKVDTKVDEEWMAHQKNQMESPDATFEIEGAMNLTCGTFLDNLGIDYARERIPEALRGTMFERAVFLIQKTPELPLWQRLTEIFGKNTTDVVTRPNWYMDLWTNLTRISDNKIQVNVLDEVHAMEKKPVIVDDLNTVGDLKRQTGFEDRAHPGGMRSARWITNLIDEPTVEDDDTLGETLRRHHSSVDEDLQGHIDPDKGYRFYRRTPRIRLESTTPVHQMERAIGIERLKCENKYADTHLEQLEQVLSVMRDTATAQAVCEHMKIELAELATLIESVADVIYEPPVEPEPADSSKILSLQGNTTVAEIAEVLGITVNAMGGEEIKYPSGPMQALEEEVRNCVGGEDANELARLLGLSFDGLGELIHEHSDVNVVQVMGGEPLTLSGMTPATEIMNAMGMSDSGAFRYIEPDLVRLEEILRDHPTDTAAMIANKYGIPFNRLVALIATKIEVEGA